MKVRVLVPIGDELVNYDDLTPEQKQKVDDHIIRVLQEATDRLYGMKSEVRHCESEKTARNDHHRHV